MYFNEWSSVYQQISEDMGINRNHDEASARMLKVLTLNSDIISEDDLSEMIGNEVIVGGGSVSDKDAASLRECCGKTIISAGAATDVLVVNGIIPDIVVTDLDGDAELQKKASASGSVTLVHAHGDNTELIAKHAKDLKGRIMITTQSSPDTVLCNFGGFTDGDRAVCTARHFGAKKITLIGFDFDLPVPKGNADPETKKKKLRWAKRIIFDMNPRDIIITML